MNRGLRLLDTHLDLLQVITSAPNRLYTVKYATYSTATFGYIAVSNKEKTMGILEDVKDNAAKEADKAILKQKIKLEEKKQENDDKLNNAGS